MNLAQTVLLLLVIIFSVSKSYAQNNAFETTKQDSISSHYRLDPIRATLLSAAIPGLGQAYNKQYWKIPIVISGFFMFGHYINYNNNLYHTLRNAAILENDNDSETSHAFSSILSFAGMTSARDRARRNRDYLMILGTGFYLLQIIDAHISAHLNDFKSENFTIKIRPSINETQSFPQSIVGVSLIIATK